jgi:hypothetical protein
MVAALGRRCITTASDSGSTRSNNSAGNFQQDIERGHRRHKGRLRAIGQLCCLLARCVLYLRRCISAGDNRPRSRPAVLRGPSAARTRRSPSLKGVARRKPWLASPRKRTRPCGFSRQGRGKRLGERASCAASSRSPRSPKETHSFFADRRTRVCGKQQHNNQTIPVVAEKAVGTPVKVQQFSDFAAEVLCLRVVPTVGTTVGIPVSIAVGTWHPPLRPSAAFQASRQRGPDLPQQLPFVAAAEIGSDGVQAV